MQSSEGTLGAGSDTSISTGALSRTPSGSAQHRRKRQTRAEQTTQPEDLHRQIGLEEYLGALDSPAAILFCSTSEGEFDSTSGHDVTPSAPTISSPPQGPHSGPLRPRLVRMTSSTGSSWPTTYGSAGSSAGSSNGRIPKSEAALTTPPNECRVIWGNRYMSGDIEEMLMDELKKENLLQRVWSMGACRSNKFYTLANKNSAERRIAWSVTPIRNGRYLTLTGCEEPQDPSSWKEDAAVVEAERPKIAPRWLDVPGETEETRRHNELFGSVDWASTQLGPPERWCQSLLTMVNLCLSIPSPCLLVWGPELVLL
jgi:hypothetical protein